MPGMETFVIRLAEPAPPSHDARSPDLHGVVEHLRSRETRPFRGTDQLLRLLVDGLATPKHVVAEQDPSASRP